MRFARRDFQCITRRDADLLFAHLDVQLPAQDEETLAGALVVVPHLARASRNALLDHAQVRAVHQPPAIADLTPPIVFRIPNVLDHLLDVPAVHDTATAGWAARLQIRQLEGPAATATDERTSLKLAIGCSEGRAVGTRQRAWEVQDMPRELNRFRKRGRLVDRA